ncbi:hypothetical protein [Stutzerimonas stutzeri]|jgi:hypothetical protein|uniref:Uncharacterized protein n=1 Tax=Stutzerimonas stutzeri TaxID=316 RepID=A0A5S5B4D7_STUST|nr:hypothetical protein [Stutzerimonas stutzeri]TYP61805.1 hypothetical protein A9A72_124555 [Stutzerimonas stutzeri]
MIRRTGEARLPRAGASLPAIHTATEPQDREQACSYKKLKHSASVAASSLASRTTRESSIREQTRAYEKPKLGARMSRAESEA